MNAKTIRIKLGLTALTAVIGSVSVILISSAFCAEEKNDAPRVTRETKEVQGEVTWVGRDKIAVVYKRELEAGKEYEILLPFDEKKVKVEHQKNMKGIMKGDTVAIQYEETNEETPKGVKTSSQAKIVSFIKRAPAEDSLQSQEDPFVLKGTK